MVSRTSSGQDCACTDVDVLGIASMSATGGIIANEVRRKKRREVMIGSRRRFFAVLFAVGAASRNAWQERRGGRSRTRSEGSELVGKKKKKTHVFVCHERNQRAENAPFHPFQDWQRIRTVQISCELKRVMKEANGLADLHYTVCTVICSRELFGKNKIKCSRRCAERET